MLRFVLRLYIKPQSEDSAVAVRVQRSVLRCVCICMYLPFLLSQTVTETKTNIRS